ncbi:MAG: hypothetical protein J2P36_22795, partial [Ktedonobacteraceae bacterium]|nr:hypothetical protein [Ktedonobacteraceae bacterium]
PPPSQYGPPQPGPYTPPPPQYGPPGPPPDPFAPPPPMPYAPPPRSGSGAGIAITVTISILLAVLLICGGGGWLLLAGIQRDNASHTQATATSDAQSTADSQDADATSTALQATTQAELTPTPFPPYSESHPPSGSDFSGTAQSILTNAQMASAVYSDNQPKTLTSTFSPYQTIYLSYKLTPGNTGYAFPKWYQNGDSGKWGKGVALSGRSGYGYFSATYYGKSQGAVELYWCTKSDCSDGQLAWVRTFEVTDS